MKRNISGINGRNVTFLKGIRYVNAYIIKYTDRGDYFALDKSTGKPYKFSKGAIFSSSYDELSLYGLEVTEENWREYIDYGSENPCSGIGDFLELVKSVLCALWLVCFGISAVCFLLRVEPFPYRVYGCCIFSGGAIILISLWLTALYYRNDNVRINISECEGDVDYHAVKANAKRKKCPRSPNAYRALLLISAGALMSMVFHVIDGRYYSVGGWLGVVFLISSTAIMGIKLKRGKTICGLRWAMGAIVMITYLLAAWESGFGAKLIQLGAAAVFTAVFIKKNRSEVK